VAGVMRKSWAVEQCLDYFRLSREDAQFIASREGAQHLAALYDADPATFYDHPLQILRQEVWHQVSYASFFEQYGFWRAIPHHGTILDFGCGTAETARLPWITIDREYCGVETSQTVQAYDRYKYRDYQRFYTVSTLDDAPLADGLICTDCFEHVPDPIGLTAQLWEYLRPGGHALLRFSDAYPHPGHLQESIAQIPDWFQWITGHGVIVELGTFLWIQKHS